MNALRTKLAKQKIIIGMVHLLPLPGSPNYKGDMEAIYEAGLKDLKALEKGGAGAVIIENFGDVPYAAENELINKIAFDFFVCDLTKYAIGHFLSFHLNNLYYFSCFVNIFFKEINFT